MIEDSRKELEKGANAISKRSVSSVVNGGCTRPSNIIGVSDFDCYSHIKNGGFHQFDTALQSAPDRIVIAYVEFRIQQKSKKLKTKMSLKLSAKS